MESVSAPIELPLAKSSSHRVWEGSLRGDFPPFWASNKEKTKDLTFLIVNLCNYELTFQLAY